MVSVDNTFFTSGRGPPPSVIESFGIKHVARSLAEKANVPTVPGTKDLVADSSMAVKEADKLGYPVILKSTAGGGGLGLVACNNADEVRKGFETATSRGKTLFKHSGVFIEKYYPRSRHVEIQIFGNGNKVIAFGERECSLQRRHQKIIEECPSPFVARYQGLREAIAAGAISLAESVQYASAGTVEFLVDNESGGVFFLEMNTRLQVEHGITELCYGVDLVNLMLQQADEPLANDFLQSVQAAHSTPVGHAIEARLYAENPIRNYTPSPGLLTNVNWPDGARVDTWVSTGTRISSLYDPLIAKVMCHRESREAALGNLQEYLAGSTIDGPPNNKDLLVAILQDDEIRKGNTLTSFVESFNFVPCAIDVISGGSHTLIQGESLFLDPQYPRDVCVDRQHPDLPARPHVGRGIPQSGPMDPVALQIANALVGNPLGTEALECTLTGPDLRFLGSAIIALTGAHMKTTLDGRDLPLWQQVRVKQGQRLKIGKVTSEGCRSYLAVFGGFPNVAKYFGSKSTSPLVALGGYQGRALAAGDMLSITKDSQSTKVEESTTIPQRLRPQYTNGWDILAMPGPHDVGYLTDEDIQIFYNTVWKVSHNAARSGIRLVGPVPNWARSDGGEGGAHPSNVIEYGYSVGSLNWTGDDPCWFPVDGPNFGGFISSTTVPKADWTKLGQLKAGDTLRCHRCTLDEALEARTMIDNYVDGIAEAVLDSSDFSSVQLPSTLSAVKITHSAQDTSSVLASIPESQKHSQPLVVYRQCGDGNLLIDYGHGSFDLNYRIRVSALENALLGRQTAYASQGPGKTSDEPSPTNASTTVDEITPYIIITVGACNSLLVSFDPLKLPRQRLLDCVMKLESTALGDLSTVEMPTRLFHLPIAFESKEQAEATRRYMQTQRPHAPYLPDNLGFVARNNAFSPEHLKEIFTKDLFMAVVVGFYSGNTVSLPVDPRQRMSSPKTNPSRVYTPAGTVGWGGGCFSIYPVDSPGGYQMLGRTVPTFDAFGRKPGFSPGPEDEGQQGCAGKNMAARTDEAIRPWLFDPIDTIRFYEVTPEDLDIDLEKFNAGLYKYEVETTTFSMKEHNELLQSTAAEVVEIRRKQRDAQAEMIRAEEESLHKWREQNDKEKPNLDEVAKVLAEDGVVSVEAPVDANVWQVRVREAKSDTVHDSDEDEEDEMLKKTEVRAGDDLVVLEAMKLEVEVKYGVDAQGESSDSSKAPPAKIEKVLVKSGETVKAGQRLCLLRMVD
ncbi:MAG: hypothetical protein Q9159_005963 [Coniocarpon cinnabarinum]